MNSKKINKYVNNKVRGKNIEQEASRYQKLKGKKDDD